jgi:hypothetical protein
MIRQQWGKHKKTNTTCEHDLCFDVIVQLEFQQILLNPYGPWYCVASTAFLGGWRITTWKEEVASCPQYDWITNRTIFHGKIIANNFRLSLK